VNRAAAIAWHEFRTTLRRPIYRVMTLAFPLLALLGILGYSVFQSRGLGQGQPVAMGYVDQAQVVTGFHQQGKVAFQPFPDLAEGRKALIAGEVKSLYVIPRDYSATGLVMEYTTESGLSMSRDANRPLEDLLVANILNSAGAPAWLADRVRAPALVQRIQLDKAGDAVPGTKAVNTIFFFVMGILLLLSIFTSSGFLLNGIGEEKENRVIEVLLSSVTPAQLMMGKILGLGVAGLLQMAVWVLAGRGLLVLASETIAPLAGIPLPGATVLLGIPYFILGFLLFAILMAGLGSVTTTAREGQQMSAIFVIPAAIPYYAFPYIASHPDGFWARLLTFVPLTSPITAMERLGASSIAAWEIAASLAILLASCAGAMWLVVRLFRAYLLMYGKRPGVREMWRALRAQ